MSTKDLFAKMFYDGVFFITHFVTCETHEDKYLITDEQGDIIFETTRENYELIRKAHPALIEEHLPCGCVGYTIEPTWLVEDKQIAFSLS